VKEPTLNFPTLPVLIANNPCTYCQRSLFLSPSLHVKFSTKIGGSYQQTTFCRYYLNVLSKINALQRVDFQHKFDLSAYYVFGVAECHNVEEMPSEKTSF